MRGASADAARTVGYFPEPCMRALAGIAFVAFVAFVALAGLSCARSALLSSRPEAFDAAGDGGGWKRVWLLWLQGWEHAPWLVRRVRESWEVKNPGWKVELVTEANLSQYVDIPYLHDDMTPQAKSDIIRLHLLAAHGGVWADATLPCLVPLDEWVDDMVRPAGCWMYHGRDEGRGPASWFIVAKPGCELIRKWRDACVAYWRGRREAHDYFWMDALFATLQRTDPEFQRQWDSVPFIWCEAAGQAHMLAGRVMSTCDDLKWVLRHTPPFVVKLSVWQAADEESYRGTVTEEALRTASRRLATVEHVNQYI